LRLVGKDSEDEDMGKANLKCITMSKEEANEALKFEHVRNPGCVEIGTERIIIGGLDSAFLCPYCGRKCKVRSVYQHCTNHHQDLFYDEKEGWFEK